LFRGSSQSDPVYGIDEYNPCILIFFGSALSYSGDEEVFGPLEENYT